jgi:hypothetical protein
MVRQARTALFGELTDNAIQRRVQRAGTAMQERVCAEPGCEAKLRRTAGRQSRYCVRHGTGRARTRRSRRRAANRETTS